MNCATQLRSINCNGYAFKSDTRNITTETFEETENIRAFFTERDTDARTKH
jgi:hypothetical protein